MELQNQMKGKYALEKHKIIRTRKKHRNCSASVEIVNISYIMLVTSKMVNKNLHPSSLECIDKGTNKSCKGF